MKQPIYATPGDNTTPIVGWKFVETDGNFVDNELNDEVAAAKNSYFFDADIIPMVQYQVFGLDNVWFWDNEGQNYTFDETTKSTIKIQVSFGNYKTYYKVVDDSGLKFEEITEPTIAQMNSAKGEIASGDAEVPTGAEVNDVYYTVTENLVPSSAVANTPYEFNKYNKNTYNGREILVSITPAQALVQKYPGAIVTINGKEYDLNYLANITVSSGTYTVGDAKPIRLYMDKDYRISINWSWGSVVETFRIICNR
jgi:hypothetical protein